jgi:hypothetical protein
MTISVGERRGPPDRVIRYLQKPGPAAIVGPLVERFLDSKTSTLQPE